MKVEYKVVKSAFKSWETLFKEAAEVASSVGPDRLINITSLLSGGEGVITVWYWSFDGEPAAPPVQRPSA
jgi:hypothetical protein